MLTTKERNKATKSSSDNGILDALAVCGRTGRVEHDGLGGSQTPLAALKRAVGESFVRARDAPACGAHFLGEPGFGQADRESDEASVFEMLSRHVRAAQRAGELKAADASLLTTLIIGAIVGTADFLQYARPNRKRLASDAEFPPLLLLDLLSTKGCN